MIQVLQALSEALRERNVGALREINEELLQYEFSGLDGESVHELRWRLRDLLELDEWNGQEALRLRNAIAACHQRP